MDAAEIAAEAQRWMARANEVKAEPGDVLAIMSFVLGQLLHEHTPDEFRAVLALGLLNRQSMQYFQEARDRHAHGTLH
jgi:hypothetical protein